MNVTCLSHVPRSTCANVVSGTVLFLTFMETLFFVLRPFVTNSLSRLIYFFNSLNPVMTYDTFRLLQFFYSISAWAILYIPFLVYSRCVLTTEKHAIKFKIVKEFISLVYLRASDLFSCSSPTNRDFNPSSKLQSCGKWKHLYLY